MDHEFTAVFVKEDDWYLGWVMEVPGANAQERTIEEARVSLREALRDILEVNRELGEKDLPAGDVIRERISLFA